MIPLDQSRCWWLLWVQCYLYIQLDLLIQSRQCSRRFQQHPSDRFRLDQSDLSHLCLWLSLQDQSHRWDLSVHAVLWHQCWLQNQVIPWDHVRQQGQLHLC